MNDPNFKKVATSDGRKRENSIDSHASTNDKSEKSIKQNQVKATFDWSKFDPNEFSDEELDA